MAANELRAQARELWEQSGGTLPLKEIAQELGVPESTVRNWKARDAWAGGNATSQSSATRRQRAARTNARIARTVDKAEALSEVEKDFCLHYVQCYSPTQAAWRTNHYATYGSARNMGFQMIRKPAVQAEVKRLKEIKRAGILADADDIIEWHMRVAFADMTDVVAWAYDQAARTNRVGAYASSQVDGQLISEVAETERGFRIKRLDPHKSMEFLERFFLLDPLNKHRIEFERRKLALEERKAAEGNEDALSRLDDILAGIDQVMQHGD